MAVFQLVVGTFSGDFCHLKFPQRAEGEGFEPTERCKNAHLISSQAHSTTLSTLRNSPFRVLKCTNHAHVHPIGGAFAAQRYSEFLISPNPLYIIILKRFQKIIWQLLFHVIFAYINKVRELTQIKKTSPDLHAYWRGRSLSTRSVTGSFTSPVCERTTCYCVVASLGIEPRTEL